MGDDALFPIRTEGAGPEIDSLTWELSCSKADLGRFLGRPRETVSRWANGHVRVPERETAAIRFLREAANSEREDGDLILRSYFGEWALPLGIRRLVAARYRRLGELEEKLQAGGPLLAPGQVREIRQALGWIQAEMAAFFGVTHSTPAKWEDSSLEDPRAGPVTEAELLALKWHVEEWHAEESRAKERRAAASGPVAGGANAGGANAGGASENGTKARAGADGPDLRDLWQEGISAFMTDIVGWEAGILPESYI